jgi:pyrroline-5-carboxylate reductase
MKQDKANVKDLLSCIGNVIELTEIEMGMSSELVSCMPGFIAAIFNEICTLAKKHTSIEADEVVQMVLNTMIGTEQLMIEKNCINCSYRDVFIRVAAKGGITKEGIKVIQESFPQVSDSIFDKALEKRRYIQNAGNKKH